MTNLQIAELGHVFAQRLIYGMSKANEILKPEECQENLIAAGFLNTLDETGQLLQRYCIHNNLEKCLAHSMGGYLDEDDIKPYTDEQTLKTILEHLASIQNQTNSIDAAKNLSYDALIEDMTQVLDASALPQSVTISDKITEAEKQTFVDDMKIISQCLYHSLTDIDEDYAPDDPYYEQGHKEAYLWVMDTLDQIANTPVGQSFEVTKELSWNHFYTFENSTPHMN